MIVLPNKTTQVWNRFLKENKTLVYKYVVRQIEKGIKENTDRVDLFKSEDDMMHASVPKEKYLVTLQDALDIFIKAEEYETAAKTKTMIIEYQIDNLIKESRNIEE